MARNSRVHNMCEVVLICILFWDVDKADVWRGVVDPSIIIMSVYSVHGRIIATVPLMV